MDALIYTAMSGAERALRGQQVHANNLANIDTNGFRATMELSTSRALGGYGYDDRHMSEMQANTVMDRTGTLKSTGRDLDVAINGEGYFAVQPPGGGEAYTRAGAITLDADGTMTVNGRPLLGEGGPIRLPQHTRVEIGSNGTVSIQTPGTADMQVVDKLKLVKAEGAELTKNAAGLLVARDNQALAADNTVAVQAGHLEGSNVSAVEEMVATMSLNRTFDVQMKLFKANDAMAEAGNRLIGG
ncbi:flagellar basal body rod protein FlgF [Pseudoduganella namucuonensis]|uniref:Flagellar basal-body rod protein FlgF n=1 Tax=Pseudoduganella namucuonensis TaxID=1035707 RepID=A0A1I7HUF2_9BURK|nr:flagellar basal body rod protein FlgF [Pseudoduganella namucuonensis]SFU64364.1 flagellar basal-body rod protein FlgF [Pseudoduganella namucuonensis]